MKVLRLATVDSTNLEARRLAEGGEQGPLWIVADEQTAGRGRLGRSWVSEPGNLYSTLLWPSSAPQGALAQLSFVAAIAVHETATRFANPSSISLKWPNDCLLGGAKFCGILAEVIRPGLVAIGIGINIAHVPEGLPYKAARLQGAGVDAVFQQLSPSLSHWLEIWREGQGFAAIRKAWEERCAHLGQPVTVDELPGRFLGLAEDGALVFAPEEGAPRRVYAGDVRVGYQAGP
ncbi:MAG: biotin--[acetyl-CoA-carboxylase] ligase [Alphaproteobacteria bacterium]|nr:biotin--[acetyl-CoA-carboxylase] ligase [Alphaproteobacteria bacterium]